MINITLTEQTTPRVKSIIEQLQELTPIELVALMQVISQLLAQTFNPFRSKTLEEIRIEQGSRVIHDVSELRADFWPEDETVEEFSKFLAEERTIS